MGKRREQRRLERQQRQIDQRQRRWAVFKSLWGSLLLIVMGLVLLVRPDLGTTAVAAVVGWVLIAVGGVGVTVSLLSWPVMGLGQLAAGIAAAAAGIFLLVRPEALFQLLGLGLGICLVAQGLGSLMESRRLEKIGLSFWPQRIFALIGCVLGPVLIFFPLGATHWVIRVAGAALVIWGGAGAWFRLRAARLLSRPEDDEQ